MSGSQDPQRSLLPPGGLEGDAVGTGGAWRVLHTAAPPLGGKQSAGCPRAWGLQPASPQPPPPRPQARGAGQIWETGPPGLGTRRGAWGGVQPGSKERVLGQPQAGHCHAPPPPAGHPHTISARAREGHVGLLGPRQAAAAPEGTADPAARSAVTRSGRLRSPVWGGGSSPGEVPGAVAPPTTPVFPEELGLFLPFILRTSYINSKL